jgi:hypothetical protein
MVVVVVMVVMEEELERRWWWMVSSARGRSEKEGKLEVCKAACRAYQSLPTEAVIDAILSVQSQTQQA